MITPSHVRIAAKLAKLESQCLGSAFYCFTRLLKQTNAFTRGGSGFRLFQSLRFDSRHPCDEQVLRRFKLTGIQKKLDSLDSLFLWHALPSPVELPRSWRGPQCHRCVLLCMMAVDSNSGMLQPWWSTSVLLHSVLFWKILITNQSRATENGLLVEVLSWWWTKE